jgi:hypothetical protein
MNSSPPHFPESDNDEDVEEEDEGQRPRKPEDEGVEGEGRLPDGHRVHTINNSRLIFIKLVTLINE